jgi:hypothetical protein
MSNGDNGRTVDWRASFVSFGNVKGLQELLFFRDLKSPARYNPFIIIPEEAMSFSVLLEGGDFARLESDQIIDDRLERCC